MSMSSFSVDLGGKIAGGNNVNQVKHPVYTFVHQQPVCTVQGTDTFCSGIGKIDEFKVDMCKKYGEPQFIEKVKHPIGGSAMGKMLLWKDKNGNNKAAFLVDETQYPFNGLRRMLGVRFDDKQAHITCFYPSGKTHNVDVSACSEQKMQSDALFLSIVDRYSSKMVNQQLKQRLSNFF